MWNSLLRFNSFPPPPRSPRLNFEWLAWKLSIKNEISKSLAEMFSLNFIVSI